MKILLQVLKTCKSLVNNEKGLGSFINFFQKILHFRKHSDVSVSLGNRKLIHRSELIMFWKITLTPRDNIKQTKMFCDLTENLLQKCIEIR